MSGYTAKVPLLIRAHRGKKAEQDQCRQHVRLQVRQQEFMETRVVRSQGFRGAADQNVNLPIGALIPVETVKADHDTRSNVDCTP